MFDRCLLEMKGYDNVKKTFTPNTQAFHFKELFKDKVIWHHT
jgi:hypothetical protein